MRSALIAALTVSLIAIAACSDAGRGGTNVNVNTNGTPVATSGSGTDTGTLTTGTPAATAALDGRTIYTKNCAVCHRDNGTGGKMTIEGKSLNVEDLTSAKIKAMDNNKLIGYVINGVEDEGMPAFKDKLSEEEIREVVQYVRVGIQKIVDPAAAEPK